VHEPLITVVGNVARVPTLRTVAGGAFVADFRVASTPRRLDKGTGEWSDGQTLWFGVTCWSSLAENVAASLHTGLDTRRRAGRDQRSVRASLTPRATKETAKERRSRSTIRGRSRSRVRTEAANAP